MFSIDQHNKGVLSDHTIRHHSEFPLGDSVYLEKEMRLVTVSYIIIRYGTLVNTIMNILDAFYVLTSIPVKAMYFSFAKFPTLFLMSRSNSQR